jgi:hypothetical protein
VKIAYYPHFNKAKTGFSKVPELLAFRYIRLKSLPF